MGERIGLRVLEVSIIPLLVGDNANASVRMLAKKNPT